MNIALFSDTYPPEINGVATSTFNLRKVLHEHGHNVVVVTTNPFSKKVTFDGETIRIPGAELSIFMVIGPPGSLTKKPTICW
jgi:1,2-diacylglycerol 3-alpha-glucosyltransferase